MELYTKEQFLLAAELGEVSMIDARHVVSLLDEAVQVKRDIKAKLGLADVNVAVCDFCEKPHRVEQHNICQICRVVLGD
jgi:translation initiation factor 2 gamma subunit (eIF-2gamma)